MKTIIVEFNGFIKSKNLNKLFLLWRLHRFLRRFLRRALTPTFPIVTLARKRQILRRGCLDIAIWLRMCLVLTAGVNLIKAAITVQYINNLFCTFSILLVVQHVFGFLTSGTRSSASGDPGWRPSTYSITTQCSDWFNFVRFQLYESFMNNQYYFCIFYLPLCWAVGVERAVLKFPCFEIRWYQFAYNFLPRCISIELATCYTRKQCCY